MKETVKEKEYKVIDVENSKLSNLVRQLYKLAESPLEQLLAFNKFNHYYNQSVANQNVQTNFFQAALKAFDIKYTTDGYDINKLPNDGPLVVISNHPFGGADGIIVGALITSFRSDLKLLVNYLLNNMPALRPWLIQVNPFGGVNAHQTNLGPLKESIKWLRNGGVLATFPSGTVSHRTWSRSNITDPKWNPATVSLIRKTNSTVLPIFFKGSNSNFFQTAGLVHPLLRTILLPGELVKRVSSHIELTIGEPISPNKIAQQGDNENAIKFLRDTTYNLAVKS